METSKSDLGFMYCELAVEKKTKGKVISKGVNYKQMSIEIGWWGIVNDMSRSGVYSQCIYYLVCCIEEIWFWYT